MRTLKLKKTQPAELQPKLIVLKASGVFDDNILKLIEIANLNGSIIELSDEQFKLLEEMQLIESGIEKEEKNLGMAKEHIEKENSMNIARTRDYDNLGSTEEPYANQQGERTKIEKELEMNSTEGIAHEIDATVQIKNDEKEQEKQYAPKTQEEIANMPPEQVKKMFYLSPERMIASMKRINNGKAWDSLARNSKDKLELQTAIEKAYRSCVYPNDLTNPDFLDKRIGDYLPENNQAVQMKELHMAALMGTYVGYHIEKNEGDIDNIDANGNEKNDVAILKFPMLVSDMPESLKSQTNQKLINSIKSRVKEIMDIPDSYRALILLMPIENTIDKAIDDYSEGLHDTQENKAVRAYIKAVRHDMSEEMQSQLDDLNVTLDLYGLNWNDKETRKSVINMVKSAQGEGKTLDVSKFVEEINMSFEVKSPADLVAVSSACEDLSELSEQGIKVNIAFEIPPEQVGNLELQAGLDDIVGEYENIKRGKTTEIVDNGIDYVLSKSVQNTLAIGTMKNPEDNFAQNLINSISIGATALSNIGPEIGRPEIRRMMPTGGSGI